MQYGPFGKSTVTAKTVPAAAVAVLAVLARNIALRAYPKIEENVVE